MFKRFKKLMFTTVLGIGVLAFTPIGSQAGVGCFDWNFLIGSYCLNSGWTGLGNCDGCASIEVTLDVDLAQCYCVNGGGQDGGIGEPFTPLDAPITGEDIVNDDNFTARGRTYSSICWDESYIDGILAQYAPADACDQNDNWSVGSCFILSTDVTIEGCVYDNKDNWEHVRTITGHCDWNDSTSEYDCVQYSDTPAASDTACPFPEPPAS